MNYKDTFMQWLFKVMFTIISTKTITVALTFYALQQGQISGTQYMSIAIAFFGVNVVQKFATKKNESKK